MSSEGRHAAHKRRGALLHLPPGVLGPPTRETVKTLPPMGGCCIPITRGVVSIFFTPLPQYRGYAKLRKQLDNQHLLDYTQDRCLETFPERATKMRSPGLFSRGSKGCLGGQQRPCDSGPSFLHTKNPSSINVHRPSSRELSLIHQLSEVKGFKGLLLGSLHCLSLNLYSRA